MINNPHIRIATYGLPTGPAVLDHLFQHHKDIDWDKRPDPERFTLREMVAHLADMEEIWLQRVDAIVQTPGTTLAGKDPDDLAQQNGYENLDPFDSLNRYSQGRNALISRLEQLPIEQWTLAGQHTDFGEFSILQVAQFSIGHDGYHLCQTIEWLK
jgi:uncharacterized damage-inducible protein DinB